MSQGREIGILVIGFTQQTHRRGCSPVPFMGIPARVSSPAFGTNAICRRQIQQASEIRAVLNIRSVPRHESGLDRPPGDCLLRKPGGSSALGRIRAAPTKQRLSKADNQIFDLSFLFISVHRFFCFSVFPLFPAVPFRGTRSVPAGTLRVSFSLCAVPRSAGRLSP